MSFIVLKDEYLGKEKEILNEIKLKCEKELKDYETPVYYEIINEIPYTQNNKQDFRQLEDIGKRKVLKK